MNTAILIGSSLLLTFGCKMFWLANICYHSCFVRTAAMDREIQQKFAGSVGLGSFQPKGRDRTFLIATISLMVIVGAGVIILGSTIAISELLRSS